MQLAASLDTKIVILSYNHPDLTERCVKSALDFVSPERILLVHNGSEKKWVQRQQQGFPTINHLVLPENKGYSGGANAGLKSLFAGTHPADWILFLTNDCLLLTPPNPPPRPGIFSPTIWARKIGRVDSLGGNLNLRRAHLSHRKDNQPVPGTHQHFYIPGTAFWVNRSAFTITQGFDEALGTYWEDVDWSLRAQQLGLETSTHSETQILHGIGKTCHSSSHYTTYLYQRNRKRICLRHAKDVLSKATICSFLFFSWSRLVFKKIQRKQFQDVKKLWLAFLH